MMQIRHVQTSISHIGGMPEPFWHNICLIIECDSGNHR